MKSFRFVLLIIPFLFFESCSEDFNVNAPYEDVYVLNCILKYDNTTQYAVISKNIYTANGNLPISNSIDQNIKGSEIKIFCNDSVFVMRDTTIRITDSGKETDVNCYYVNNLTLKPGTSISIEATVPEGKILKSTINVPEIVFKHYINFSGYSELSKYNWSWTFGKKDIKNIVNLPQLEIYYTKIEEGRFVNKKKLVTLSYFNAIDENGFLYYPDVQFSFNGFCCTTLKDINRSMQEISGTDPNKINYIINKVEFNVIGLDAGLSKYYSANNVYSKDFTVKLRLSDYTNIEGGKGIFGICNKYSNSLDVDTLFINSFGYQYDAL